MGLTMASSSLTMPSSALGLRVAQTGPARVQRLASARRLTAPRIAARRGSLDASTDEHTVENLELVYQGATASHESPLLWVVSMSSQDVQELVSSSLDQPHRQHNEELCGKMVCVEHTIDDATGDVVGVPDADLPQAQGMFATLFDKLPFSKRTRGIVMLNLLVLLVATNWVVVKDVGSTFDPFGFAFLRFGVAALAFAPFMKSALKDKRIVAAGMELGMWTAAGYITQSAGLLTTDASRASFLSTFTVLVVPFLAGITGKGVSAVTWASCIAALVGVGLLEQGGAPAGVGDIWSFLSAVAFGIQVFRTEHHARQLGNGSNLGLMSVVLTTTMLFSAVAAAMTHPQALADMLHNPGMVQAWFTSDSVPWHQVLYCGLLTTDLALMMEVFALQDVSSVDAAIIYTLEPVLGAAFAWALLGERISSTGMVGAVIILASSLFSQVMGGSSTEAAEEGAPALAAASKDD